MDRQDRQADRRTGKQMESERERENCTEKKMGKGERGREMERD